MLSFLWAKKPNNLRLEVQKSVLANGLDDMQAITAELEEVRDKLVEKANGALVKLRSGDPNGEGKSK